MSGEKRKHGNAAMTCAEVADAVGCCVKHVRTMIHRGELLARNIGTAARPRYRISRAVFRAFMRECEVTGISGFDGGSHDDAV